MKLCSLASLGSVYMVVLLSCVVFTNGAEQADIFAMSLEDLMNLDVTTASKSPQKLADIPAAAYVVTGEDIRRMGALHIAEVLRTVPGMNVARADSHRWAVSARGFNRPFSTKLLVMIDGRTIYNPLFSGVYWDVQDLVMEDIDRIEVIRGPGASLWGANAVNGIVNIITKSAWDTQGAMVSIAGGDQDRLNTAVRYGWKKNNVAYRVFVKYAESASNRDSSDHDAEDDYDLMHSGFRMDWNASGKDNVTFQSDIYDGSMQNHTVAREYTAPYASSLLNKGDVTGGNLLGRWSHVFSDTANTAFQVYYDRFERVQTIDHSEERDTCDIDFQHAFELFPGHTILWGWEYRYTQDEVKPGASVLFSPDKARDNLYSAFIQDTVEIVDDCVYATVGSKFEHNDYTGYELQPTARLIWKPVQRCQLWSAVSRAVRTASRFDQDAEILLSVIPPRSSEAGSLPTAIVFLGNDGVGSESVTAYEMGCRVNPTDNFLIDLAVFYNVYDHLYNAEPEAPYYDPLPVPHITQELIRRMNDSGDVYGAELSTDWWIIESWRLSAAYTYLNIDTDRVLDKKESPENQFSIRSYINLPFRMQFDAAVYYVDKLTFADIDAYVRTDVRLGWLPTDNLEFSIVGQNIFEPSHQEHLSDDSLIATEIERSVYAKVTARW